MIRQGQTSLTVFFPERLSNLPHLKRSSIDSRDHDWTAFVSGVGQYRGPCRSGGLSRHRTVGKKSNRDGDALDDHPSVSSGGGRGRLKNRKRKREREREME